MENERNLYHDLDSILYSREEIAAAVRALGERITADYRGKNPVFICILKGASVFFSDLIRQVVQNTRSAVTPDGLHPQV